MSYARCESVTITTGTNGAATAYLPSTGQTFNGRLHSIVFADTSLDAGSDFTLTLEKTGEAVWSRSNSAAGATIRPRAATHDVAGVASLYAAGGEPVEDHIVVADDRIKIVVAQGGSEKVGAFSATVF